MRIILYTCNAEYNRINKSQYLSREFQLEGILKEESSVIDPVILIEKTNPAKYNYNYMYIPEFNRWYHIQNIEHVRNKLWRINAHVDVLYTWGGDIKSSKCILEKSQNDGVSNVYLNDGSFIMDSRKYLLTIPFQTGLNENGELILICAGGSPISGSEV